MAWNKLIIALCLPFILSACSIRQNELEIKYLEVGGTKIKVELAQTEFERYRGLSGREKLCDDCGMLFVFPEARKTGFVMRDMKFPLDMIGIREGRVVAIDENCQPDEATVYQDEEMVDKVLEVKAGTVSSLGIKLGNGVIFDSL